MLGKKLYLALAIIGLGSAAAGAQTLGEKVGQVPVNAQVNTTEDAITNTPLAFSGGVTVLPDLTYASLSGYRELKLDLYLPPASFQAQGPRPLLVYVHGGGWAGGDRRHMSAYADWPKVLASVAEHGYVVAAVEYRFSSEAPFPAQIQDVKSAIRWLRAHADKYHIDPQRAMIWGQSAGGHLAGLEAVSCGAKDLEPAPPMQRPGEAPAAESAAQEPSDCVQGAVVWFGVFDFTQLPQFAHPAAAQNAGGMGALLGCGSSTPCSAEELKARLAAISPVTYVTDKAPPILIMHGEVDHTVPIAQSQEFYDLLKSKGVRTEFIRVPDVGHSWIGPSGEVTSKASNMALQKALDFIESVIGDKAAK